MNNKVKRLTFSAMIAAIYFICCFFSQEFAYGVIQCRFSEGLNILCLFFPEAIIGITIGCLIFNITTGILWDVIFGTLATLVSCIITYLIGRVFKNDIIRIVLGGLPPVILNAFIIPLVLILGYKISDAYFYLVITIGIGELIAVYVVGSILYYPLKVFFTKNRIINIDNE